MRGFACADANVETVCSSFLPWRWDQARASQSDNEGKCCTTSSREEQWRLKDTQRNYKRTWP